MVSHPLVLFMFRETITENIVKVDKSNKQLEANSLEGKIKSATAEDASLLNERIAKRDCAIQLLQAEKYPTQTQSYEVWNATRTMICGTASGKAGCDMSENGGCASIKKDIIKYDEQIKDNKKRISDSSPVTNLYLNKAKDEINTPPANDYLKKSQALGRLKDGYIINGEKYEGDIHIWWTYYIIMCFIIILDVLIVIIKATTPIGTYEDTKDILEDIHKDLLKIKGEERKVYARIMSASSTLIANDQKAKAECESIYNTMLDFVKDMGDSHAEFDEHCKQLRKRAGIFNFKEKKRIDDHILELKDIYLKACTKATDKFNQHINSL